MGCPMSKKIEDWLLARNSKARYWRVIMLGLDGSGKTSINAKLDRDIEKVSGPTRGFTVADMEFDDLSKLNVWEVGGEKELRSSWDFYFSNSEALVFVVDSSDYNRVNEAKDTLDGVLQHQYFESQRDLPVVVIANKQDDEDSMSASEILYKLEVSVVSAKRPWIVTGAVAKTGECVHIAFKLLHSVLSRDMVELLPSMDKSGALGYKSSADKNLITNIANLTKVYEDLKQHHARLNFLDERV
ncbi:uncharacterized protein [Antedon mediterranea]|uniref:uncharacterized protein n=1 Tax=Antedon mediterranea TaxID=105859 RepID=UPI003AF749A1